MRINRLSAAVAVVALGAAPAFAATNPAASLSLANGKPAVAQAQTGDDSSAAPHGGHSGTIVFAGLAAAAVIGGAVALGSGHHHHGSMPASN